LAGRPANGVLAGFALGFTPPPLVEAESVSVSETRIPRRLAAIVAADVKGYSRLMGVDEEGTLRRLSERRQEMDDLIQQFGGRIANTAGDSVIAEFPSVVAAVECAIQIQRSHADANAPLSPKQRVAFRIGLHLGDVLVKDGDLFGDGVNIAARLEQLAEPGGIALSARVKEEIAGKLAIKTENLGAHDLKNIAKPIGVWRVQLDPEVGERSHPIARLRRLKRRFLRHARIFARRRLAWTLGAIAAGIAVVASGWFTLYVGKGEPTYQIRPFTSPSGSTSGKALANALTTRLSGGLGGLPYIRLLGLDPETSGKPRPIANYVISGTVTPGSATTNIESSVTEAATGLVVATTSFEAPQRELSEMQDEILGAIGDDLTVEINKSYFSYPLDTPDKKRAWELAQEARFRTDLRAEPERALNLLEQAVTISPDNMDILGWYANTLIAIASIDSSSRSPRQTYLERAQAFLRKQNRSSQYNRLLSYANCQLAHYSGELQAALVACDETRRILPWSARVYKELGSIQMELDLLDEALTSFERADRLARSRAIRWTWEARAGLACLALGRNQEAADWLSQAATLRVDDPQIQALLGVAFKRQNNLVALQRQVEALQRYKKNNPNDDIVSDFIATYQFATSPFREKIKSLADEIARL
jgi:adenylate cyclase